MSINTIELQRSINIAHGISGLHVRVLPRSGGEWYALQGAGAAVWLAPVAVGEAEAVREIHQRLRIQRKGAAA